MTPFNNFFPPNIFTFISGHSIDFLLKKDQSALTSDQSAFLFQYCHLTDVNNILQVHGDKIIFIKDKRPKIEKADAWSDYLRKLRTEAKLENNLTQN